MLHKQWSLTTTLALQARHLTVNRERPRIKIISPRTVLPSPARPARQSKGCGLRSCSDCPSQCTQLSSTSTDAWLCAPTTYLTSKLVSGIYNLVVENDLDLLTDQEAFFHPKYTHQIYNSDETLRGHEDPSIEVFLSPSTLRPYLYWNSRCRGEPIGSDASVESKSSCLGSHSHKEDDIQGKLLQHFGADALLTSRAAFIEHLEHERTHFKPPGTLVSEFQRLLSVDPRPSLFTSLPVRSTPKRLATAKSGLVKESKTLKVYKVNAMHPQFHQLNHHLQALLQYYIEGASFIPVDEMWNYFLVYLDNKLVAYATTFEEYLKVPKAAVTISQVLVLPPY